MAYLLWSFCQLNVCMGASRQRKKPGLFDLLEMHDPVAGLEGLAARCGTWTLMLPEMEFICLLSRLLFLYLRSVWPLAAVVLDCCAFVRLESAGTVL